MNLGLKCNHILSLIVFILMNEIEKFFWFFLDVFEWWFKLEYSIYHSLKNIALSYRRFGILILNWPLLRMISFRLILYRLGQIQHKVRRYLGFIRILICWLRLLRCVALVKLNSTRVIVNLRVLLLRQSTSH